MTGSDPAVITTPKLLQVQTRVPDDAAHGERIDWIVAWNRQDSRPIRHDNMRALAKNPEARFFQSGNGSKMIDPGSFDTSYLSSAELIICRRDICVKIVWIISHCIKST